MALPCHHLRLGRAQLHQLGADASAAGQQCWQEQGVGGWPRHAWRQQLVRCYVS